MHSLMLVPQGTTFPQQNMLKARKDAGGLYKGYYHIVLFLCYCTTHHFTFLQIRTITSASNNPQTQTETSNTHVNGGMGECNEGNGVQTIWDTHKNGTAC